MSDREPRQARERGAVIPFVALMMVAIMGFTALAVDVGRQRMVRRDMQAVADVVALDLARHLDGRTAAEIGADPEFLETVDLAEERNTPPGGITELTWELGILDDERNFTAVTGASVPDAVRVVAEDDVDWFFRPGSGSAARAAIAASSASACFSVGSFALGLHSGNSALLNSLIGDALNLGVLGYDGLATSAITIGDLALELGAGTVEELTDTTVAYDDFLLAVAEVMQRNGDTANAQFLQSIATSVGALPPVSVGDLLNLSPSSDAALGGSVNVLDLLAGSAFLANGSNALAIPTSTLNLLGLTSATTSLSIVQSPQIACGPIGTQAQTSQIAMTVDASHTNVGLTIPGVGGVTTNVGPISLNLDTAQAIGTLTEVLCGDPEGIDLNVITALLQAGIDIPVRIRGDVTLLGILGLVRVDIQVTLSASTNVPVTSSDVEIEIPPDAYFETKEVGTGSVGLSGLSLSQTAMTVSARLVLGLINVNLNVTQRNQLLNPVINDIINPLIADIDELLLGPLTDLLGLNVAGADVAALPREEGTPCSGYYLAG